MAEVLTAQVDELRGLVRLSAAGVVPGSVVLTRRVGNESPVTIRGGVFDVSTGGFIRSDSEAVFGADLTYRLVESMTSRYLQSNRVLNPKFALNTTNWTFDASRTVARETDPALAPPRDATTSARIGPRTAGAGAGGLTERMLAKCSPSGLTTGTWYISGQMRYDSPDIWLWEDARAAGTWATIKAKGTWQTVKSSTSSVAEQAFASLHMAVLNAAGTVLVGPIQVIGVQTSANGNWVTFQATVTIPAGAGANCQLAFYQGTVTREYAVTWWLSTVMATPTSEINSTSVLPYFDADTPLSRLGDLGLKMVPGYDWRDLSGDGSLTWNGTPNASISILTGPSQVFTETVARFSRPTPQQLPGLKLPIFLSDPVVPQLSQWFELVEIGDLSFAARQQLYDVLSREAQIAVSQLRAWPSGNLRLMTRTLEENEVVQRLFGTGRILFLRNPDPRFPENGWYIAVGDVASGRVGATVAWSPERLWSVPFVKVERPEGLIAASSNITWDTVKTGYTWKQLRDMRKDWLDVALTKP